MAGNVVVAYAAAHLMLVDVLVNNAARIAHNIAAPRSKRALFVIAAIKPSPIAARNGISIMRSPARVIFLAAHSCNKRSASAINA